jgi:hypothetical protein
MERDGTSKLKLSMNLYQKYYILKCLLFTSSLLTKKLNGMKIEGYINVQYIRRVEELVHCLQPVTVQILLCSCICL